MRIKCVGRQLRRGFTREQRYQAGSKVFVLVRLIYRPGKPFRIYGPLTPDIEFPRYGRPRRVQGRWRFGSNTSWKSAEQFLQKNLYYFLNFDD